MIDKKYKNAWAGYNKKPSLIEEKISAVTAKSAGNGCNVILICWDGVQRNVLKGLIRLGRLPNIASFSEEGQFLSLRVRGKTDTKASHAQMITGLPPHKTGVFSNGRHAPIPKGLTIFEMVQKKLGRENIVVTAILSKGKHLGCREPKEPFLLTKKEIDIFDTATRPAYVTGPICLEILERFKDNRFLHFFHFGDPDHLGHKYGDGKWYKNGIIECDKWLGLILGWVEENDPDKKTLVYVVTDHGFVGHCHSNAPKSWMITNDMGIKRGGIVADIGVTIMGRFGVDPKSILAKRRGHVLY